MVYCVCVVVCVWCVVLLCYVVYVLFLLLCVCDLYLDVFCDVGVCVWCACCGV